MRQILHQGYSSYMLNSRQSKSLYVSKLGTLFLDLKSEFIDSTQNTDSCVYFESTVRLFHCINQCVTETIFFKSGYPFDCAAAR